MQHLFWKKGKRVFRGKEEREKLNVLKLHPNKLHITTSYRVFSVVVVAEPKQSLVKDYTVLLF
jgi:hypothetical protein